MKKSLKIIIIGAGPAGLACAEYLSQYPQLQIDIYEQKTSAGRKFLMAGKTGLNLSHIEDFDVFIQRYDKKDILKSMVKAYHAPQIQDWMRGLGITPYIGSSGRIFPAEMKAAPLLRAWLKRLHQRGVNIHYQMQCRSIEQHHAVFLNVDTLEKQRVDFDVIVLACGGASWSRLGSDGQWQQWFSADEIEPLQGSNVGVLKNWSRYMPTYFGQPLKRIRAWTNADETVSPIFGEMVISHYGLEGGLVYRCQRQLRQRFQLNPKETILFLDLLPDVDGLQIVEKLTHWGKNKKLSLNTQWQKLGLDKTKIALVREIVEQQDWHHAERMAQHIKKLAIVIQGFRPLDEAISTAGGVKFECLNADFSRKKQENCYLCGEMLDWDAPTGGYLLTACFATGRYVAQNIIKRYNVINIS